MLYYSCGKAAVAHMGGWRNECKSCSILDLFIFSLDMKILLESTKF